MTEGSLPRPFIHRFYRRRSLDVRLRALGPLCDYAIILQAKGPADLRRDRPSGYNQVGPGPLPLTRLDCCLLLHLQGN